MSPGILVIGNPRRRRRSLTAAQIRAGFGGKRRMKSNPRRAKSHSRRRVARNPVAAAAVPARRRSRGRAFSFRRRSSSGGRRRRSAKTYYRAFRRARRRNSGGAAGFFSHAILPAGLGAMGALAIDIGWSSLPLPDALKTGPLAPVARMGGAVAIGFLAGAIGGRKIGEAVMMGGLIVTGYDLLKGYVQTALPQVTMSAYPGMAAYPGMGYVNVAPANTRYAY